jgi:hypothetical protein
MSAEAMLAVPCIFCKEYMCLQRETGKKARQPETKLSAIAQTRHIARLRDAKRSRTRNPKSTHGARDRPKQPVRYISMLQLHDRATCRASSLFTAPTFHLAADSTVILQFCRAYGYSASSIQLWMLEEGTSWWMLAQGAIFERRLSSHHKAEGRISNMRVSRHVGQTTK